MSTAQRGVGYRLSQMIWNRIMGNSAANQTAGTTLQQTAQKRKADQRKESKSNKKQNRDKTKGNLGMIMLPDKTSNMTYGLMAQYGEPFDKENPVIEVISYYAGEQNCYQVTIPRLNIRNATMLEIFALCRYADAERADKQDGRDTYEKLRKGMQDAAGKGICQETRYYDEFCLRRQDWENMLNLLKDSYLEDGAYYDYQSCLELLDLLEGNDVLSRPDTDLDGE